MMHLKIRQNLRACQCDRPAERAGGELIDRPVVGAKSICRVFLVLHVLRYIVLCVGTQRIISFLRQLVEHGGFYRTSDQAWVKFERIQFVGACNPPTDPGRKPLSHRSVTAVLRLYLASRFTSHANLSFHVIVCGCREVFITNSVHLDVF